MSNRRASHRYPIRDDRAHVSIIVNRTLHRAVLADMSATGFGMLVMRGVSIVPNESLVLVMDDAVFECQIAYCVPDDAFQRIGIRRVRDISSIELPKPVMGQTFFQDSQAGGNAFIIVAVIIGFTGLLIGVLHLAGIGGGQDKSKWSGSAYATNARDIVDDAARSIARDETIERAKAATQAMQQKIADMLLAKQRNAAAKLSGSGDVSWDTLVTRLGLSNSQQLQMLAVLEDASSQGAGSDPISAAAITRERALEVLTDQQRALFSQLLATGPA